MNKIISIVGPTTTGKTNQALSLAQEVLTNKEYAGVDLISVDSRQVYQGLEVLTGADIPAGFSQFHNLGEMPYFANVNNSIRLFGIAIIKPQDEWSVTHFRQFAREIIIRAFKEKRLPILVGGTGLYHKHLFSMSDDLSIKPNALVRAKEKNLTVTELQTWLKQVNQEKFLAMNQDDRNNRRRLVRAIEIAIAKTKVTAKIQESQIEAKEMDWSKVDRQVIKLAAPRAELEAKIKTRVKERFFGGAVEEVKALLALKLDEVSPVLSTLGVPEISQYLSGQLPESQTIDLWALHEFQYAKRQITWWKKEKNN